jgi:predicted RNase H-like HicB family nuclease/metal-responsive CopG/Arc/MetJ family transcriptional regulator
VKTYFALIHKDTDSAFGITFPDLPGCFSATDDECDIYDAAQKALELYARDEGTLSEPRTVPALQLDDHIRAELAGGAVLIAVPLIRTQHKARYNLMLDVELVAGVDQKARILGSNRSEFVAVAIRERLRRVAGTVTIQHRRRPAPTGVKAETTGKKTASAAPKVMASKTATKDEKAVAASAMAQTKTKKVTTPAVASKAGKVLHDPKASKDAKSAAASALTQAAHKAKETARKK